MQPTSDSYYPDTVPIAGAGPGTFNATTQHQPRDTSGILLSFELHAGRRFQRAGKKRFDNNPSSSSFQKNNTQNLKSQYRDTEIDRTWTGPNNRRESRPVRHKKQTHERGHDECDGGPRITVQKSKARSGFHAESVGSK